MFCCSSMCGHVIICSMLILDPTAANGLSSHFMRNVTAHIVEQAGFTISVFQLIGHTSPVVKFMSMHEHITIMRYQVLILNIYYFLPVTSILYVAVKGSEICPRLNCIELYTNAHGVPILSALYIIVWILDPLFPREVLCSNLIGCNEFGLQGYAFQMEIVVRARKLGFSIAEVCPYSLTELIFCLIKHHSQKTSLSLKNSCNLNGKLWAVPSQCDITWRPPRRARSR